MKNSKKEISFTESQKKGTAVILECSRQRLALSDNLDRLRRQLSEINELHFRVLEQLAETGELIAIIRDKK